MSPPVSPEGLPTAVDPPPPPDIPHEGEGCPPGVDPTTCCVCSDHRQFEGLDPSHPHYHRFNDRQLADELLEYLLAKERALDAERTELLSAAGDALLDQDRADEENIDAALDGQDVVAHRVVRPLPRWLHGHEVRSVPSPPASPTLAEMALGAVHALGSVRTDAATAGEEPSGVEADNKGRLKLTLGGPRGGSPSRWLTAMNDEAEDALVEGLAHHSAEDEQEEIWNEGFHFTSSNLSKKRKVPSPFAGDHSPSGRSSPALHMPTTVATTRLDGKTTISSYLFPSFPALPMGYTRQNPPLSYSLRTRLVLARVSPACRANLWSKAVLSERKAIVQRKMGGAPLADDEQHAIRFAGLGWGKGVLAEAVDDRHPALRPEDSRRAKRGGMRGVQQRLSKDGLSLYAVVREEDGWTAKKAVRKPVPGMADRPFTFKVDSEASLASVDSVLANLAARLRLGPPSPQPAPVAMASLGPSSTQAPTSSRARAHGGISLARDIPLPPIVQGTVSLGGGAKLPKAVCSRKAAGGSKKKSGVPTIVKANSPPAPPAVEPPVAAVPPLAPKKAVFRKISKAPAGLQNPPVQPVAPVAAVEPQPAEVKTPSPVAEPTQLPPVVLSPPTAGGKKKSSKKKRSALANAGNPHHMKNYVPTRLVSDQPSQVFNPHAFMASLFFPPPTRFLSAAPPKLKAARAAAARAAPALGQPAATDDAASLGGTEEYVCVSCEYSLFYSNNAEGRRKLLSKRKKLLARKKRALDRAQGVANGTQKFGSKGSKNVKKMDEDDEDAYDGDDYECDDEILPNGQCRRCAERRAEELEQQLRKSKRKKKELEKAYADHVASVPVPAGDASSIGA